MSYQSMEDIWIFAMKLLSEHGRHLNICHETDIRAWKTFEYLPWNCYQSMEDIWIFTMKLLSEHGRHLNTCHETAIRAWKTFEYLPWKCYQSMEDIWILAMKLLSEHGRHLNICHETVWSIDMFQSSLINKTTHYYDTSNILTVVSSRRQTSVMLRLQLLGCHTFSLKGWTWTLTAEHPPISGLIQVISM